MTRFHFMLPTSNSVQPSLNYRNGNDGVQYCQVMCFSDASRSSGSSPEIKYSNVIEIGAYSGVEGKLLATRNCTIPYQH